MNGQTCVLIVVDGLRPEAIEMAPMSFVSKLPERGGIGTIAQSLMPCCTLPCHFSIFHSVPPERHGITSNVWAPQVRPVSGLFEVLHTQKKRAAFAYNWEQLRDLARPGNLYQSRYNRMNHFDGESDRQVARDTIEFIQSGEHDFIFCYLGETDEVGHRYGWLSPEYLARAKGADHLIAQIYAALPPESSLIITADHGGHDRTHGVNCPEDMTIPLYIHAPLHRILAPSGGYSLLDLAPTIAKIVGIEAPEEWEGRSIVV